MKSSSMAWLVPLAVLAMGLTASASCSKKATVTDDGNCADPGAACTVDADCCAGLCGIDGTCEDESGTTSGNTTGGNTTGGNTTGGNTTGGNTTGGNTTGGTTTGGNTTGGTSTGGNTTGGTSTGGGGDCDVSGMNCDPALAAQCLCIGCDPMNCIDPMDMSVASDCVCPSCAADEFCSNSANCTDDGICDPFNEGCICADCATNAACP